MYFYILPKIGAGTSGNPYRPNVPQTIGFVCVECREQFFVATSDEILGQICLKQSELENYCYKNRIDYNSLFVGDGG